MDVGERMDLVRDRADLLAALVEGPLDRRDLVDRLAVSRSTVDRAVRDLESASFVERTGEGYRATLAGATALAHYRAYREGWESLVAATPTLAGLPAGADLPPALVVGGETVHAPDETPYEPVEALHRTVREADRYRALLPALDDPRHVRLWYEHVVTEGRSAEVVVPNRLFGSLVERFPRRMAALTDGSFDLWRGEVPDYGLLLTDHDGATTVTLVLFGTDGVGGLLRNDRPEAVARAEAVYEAAREDAEVVTELLRRATDGGRTLRDDAGAARSVGATTGPTADTGTAAPAGQSSPAREGDDALPLALERAGFVRLSPALFADQPAAEPDAAWRAGLDLVEVHTGYAVPRTDRDDGGADSETGGTDGADSVTDQLRERLRDGTDCAVVGPPGTGKSTVCKRVACEWYAAGDPVFYRESGAGRPFEAVGALVRAATRADGHALVVVEDAPRPAANTVFDAMERLADREDVSVLLDARTAEWEDADGGTDDVRVVSVPPLSREGCARLVERFERTTGASVDIPVDRLYESARAAADKDEDEAGPAPGAVSVLCHRLASYADPLDDDRTTLEADADACREALADAGETALAVGLLANVLNAAGMAVRPAYLYALAGDGSDPGTFDTAPVAEAVDLLRGRVLFGDASGEDAFRTVHETWSVAYLSRLLDRDEGGAAARFRRVVGSLLSLATDDDTRRRVADGTGDPLDRVAVDPGGWADDTAVRVFDGLTDRGGRLAGLLGTVDRDVSLPPGCDPETRVRLVHHRGKAYVDAGRFDRAEREFERSRELIAAADLPAERAELLDARAVRHLGKVAKNRGEFDTAAERLREARDRFAALGATGERLRCLESLAGVATDRGDYETALDRAEAGLAAAREADDDRMCGRFHNLRGNARWGQGELAAAEAAFAASIEHARDEGDRRTEAFAHSHRGLLARERGAFDEAGEQFTRALEIYRELGLRRHEALDRWNLAEIARRRGNLDEAEQYATVARDQYDRIGNRVGVAQSRVVLGEIALDRGDAATAAEHAAAALPTLREADELADRAGALLLLAGAERERGALDAAADRLDDAREVVERMDSSLGRVWCLRERGRLARDRGDDDEARERFEAGLETAREHGFRPDEAELLADLAALDATPGRARDRLATAVERYRDCAAERRALELVGRLVDRCEDAGDRAAAVEWCETGMSAAAEAGLLERRSSFRDRHEALSDATDR